MLIIDIILLILLLGFFIRGWQAGLIRMLAGLIGILAGIVLAGQFSAVLSSWLIKLPFLAQHENLTHILSLLIIFFAVSGLIGVGAYLVDRIFHIFAFIPFLKTFNHLAGALVGLLAGAFIIGFLVVILYKFPLAVFITHYFENSRLILYLIQAYNFVNPLWPEAVKQFKAVVN